MAGREQALQDSWGRLLNQLKIENQKIKAQKSGSIPEVKFSNIAKELKAQRAVIQKRGAVVVRGVVPEAEARAYKDEVEAYVRKNPHTKGFPEDDPQVFGLYWSAPQLKARSHPNLIKTQEHLLAGLWTVSPDSPISLSNPLTYVDRPRIRQPGDASFAVGPHMDGGSTERWEKNGHAIGGVYDKSFDGDWEGYNAFDASSRIDAQSNLYECLGACTMLRLWQGWLSMSSSGPKEGTLLLYPLVKLATAYLMLRSYFKPVDEMRGSGFLEASNWKLATGDDITTELHGASLYHRPELNDYLHPHLELNETMVSVPEIRPGDFVAWNCDACHAVDLEHRGTEDSSVLYIPVCPTTAHNAEYLKIQRHAFFDAKPPADFPQYEGEINHVDRPTERDLRGWTTTLGIQAMGLDRLVARNNALPGEGDVLKSANRILGF